MEDSTRIFIALLLLVVVFPVSMVLYGVVISYLWAWFVVVPFGIKALTLGQAIGLGMLVSFITYHDVDVKAPERSPWASVGRALGLAFVRPGFVLLFGYVIFSCFS
jgi:hypothetical protein